MPELPNDQSRQAVLIMDHQQLLVDNYTSDPASHLRRVARTLEAARSSSIPIFHVTVGFRPGYPEICDRNMMFVGVRDGKRFELGASPSAIPEAIAPINGEPVVVKHRVSAFEGTELSVLLRAKQIDHLVLFGIATSGVVLSTVRQAADLDFRITVISDLCADNDAEVNKLLMEKIFPRQATVLSSNAFIAGIKAG